MALIGLIIFIAIIGMMVGLIGLVVCSEILIWGKAAIISFIIFVFMVFVLSVITRGKDEQSKQ